MFYNYLIFSMVTLSLRIFKKHFVSKRETAVLYIFIRLYLWSEFITDSGQCRKIISTSTTSYFSKTCASFNTYDYFAKFKSNS